LTSGKIIVEAPCKINLGLNILGIENGYHLLDTVMMAIPLCDTVEIKLRNDGEIKTIFFCHGDTANHISETKIDPVKNTAYQAAEYVRDNFGITCGADIKIIKRVPVAAGLGGSSCDAAGVLRAYAELLRLPIAVKDAAKLGSDTAFLFAGYTTARCTGRGDILEPFEAKPLDLVIAVSGKVNTAECYRKFDELYPNYKYSLSDTNRLIEALREGNVGVIGRCIGNALEDAATELEPRIADTISLFMRTSAVAIFMSGSGAAVVGLYADKKSADRARAELLGKCDFVW